jgi:hypothetical protein
MKKETALSPRAIALGMAFAACTMTTGCGSSVQDDDIAVAPNALVAGRTYGEWAAEWWKWALAIPAADNPISGGPCSTGQEGPVWFLAGAWATEDGAVSRTCTIPADRHVFFPMLNTFASICINDPTDPCELYDSDEAILEYLAPSVAGMVDPFARVDDIDVPDPTRFRATSTRFHVEAPADPEAYVYPCLDPIPEGNRCGFPAGDIFGATDGYWVMLRPLSRGPHRVQFGGVSEEAAELRQVVDVTYDVVVRP